MPYTKLFHTIDAHVKFGKASSSDSVSMVLPVIGTFVGIHHKCLLHQQ